MHNLQIFFSINVKNKEIIFNLKFPIHKKSLKKTFVDT